MGHDAAVLDVWVPLEVEVTNFPVIDNTLFALFDVVLATIVRGEHERELLAVLVSRTIVGEFQFMSFRVIIRDVVRIFINLMMEKCELLFASKPGG